MTLQVSCLAGFLVDAPGDQRNDDDADDTSKQPPEYLE